MLRRSAGEACLRFGIIGPGEHASEHLLPALAQLDGVRLTAVAARSHDRARAAADRWGATRYSGEWRDLLDPDAVDALIVAATPELHAEVMEVALRLGVSVFVEKPPAPTTSSLERLIAHERTAPAGTVAFVGFNFPYGASYVTLRDALTPHGEIRSFDVRLVSSKPLEAEHGESLERTLLLGLGSHAIDMAVREMGAPASVDVSRTRIDERRLIMRIWLGYPDGRLASVQIGNHSNRLEYRCELTTADAVTGVLDQHNVLTLAEAGKSPRRASIAAKETVRYEWPSRRGGYARTGYLPELDSFRRSVAEGLPSSSSLTASLTSYKIIDRVQEL